MRSADYVRTLALAGALLAVSCGSDSTGPPPADLEILTESLPSALVNEAYSAGVNAEGGRADYSWSLISGALPPGLVSGVEDLSDDDLVISGTPEEPGTYGFTLQVESGDGQTASRAFELVVLPPPSSVMIETLLMPPALQNAIYASQLRASGGDRQTYTWSLVGGSLPPGLELTPEGMVEGVPTTLGRYTFTVEVTSGAFSEQATFVIEVVADDQASFNITLLEVVEVPENIRPHVLAAAERWEEVLAADLGAIHGPEDLFRGDHCGGFGEEADGTSVDDILMLVNIDSIDGPGKVLGRAGPCGIRNSNTLPFVGILTLDSKDLQPITGTQTLTDIIAHEMGHILGFGSLWDLMELVEAADSSNPTFLGQNATEEYRALGGTGAVPLEEDGGEGTALSHWDEEEFGNEIMTGFTERIGITQPLSRLTVGAFEDMGYVVDYSSADPYSLNPLLVAEGYRPPPNLGYDHVYDEPVRAIDARGDVRTVPLRRVR